MTVFFISMWTIATKNPFHWRWLYRPTHFRPGYVCLMIALQIMYAASLWPIHRHSPPHLLLRQFTISLVSISDFYDYFYCWQTECLLNEPEINCEEIWSDDIRILHQPYVVFVLLFAWSVRQPNIRLGLNFKKSFTENVSDVSIIWPAVDNDVTLSTFNVISI